MAYSVEDIDKILGFTSWSDKRKIEKPTLNTLKNNPENYIEQ